MQKRWPIFIATLCSFICMAVHSVADTHYVAQGGVNSGNCTDSNNPCATIEYAYFAATDGDIISVATGVYTEVEIVLQKDLSIIGQGASNTIVQAHALPNTASNRVFFVFVGQTCTLERITIRHGREPDGASGGAAGGAGGSSGGIHNNGMLTIASCIVTANRAGDGGDGTVSGGFGGYGGGVRNSGHLIIRNSMIVSNMSGSGGDGPTPGGAGNGGGIANRFTVGGSKQLTIEKSTIAFNETGSGGNAGFVAMSTGERGGHGAGIYMEIGTATVTKCLIESNFCGAGGTGFNFGGVGGSGGGIYAFNSLVELLDTTVRGNVAGSGASAGSQTNGFGGDGGGIAIDGAVIASVTNSTISGNLAGDGGSNASSATAGNGGRGGGIYNRATLRIGDSTISGNSSGAGGSAGGLGTGGDGGDGGGLYNNSSALLARSTIVSNTTGAAGSGGFASGTGGDGGGTILGPSGNSTLPNNSIIADNTVASGGSGPDCSGLVVFQNYCLLGNSNGCTIGGNTTGNITNQSPVLGPLQDNGGCTETHALLGGSPAIDAADPAFTAPPITDQRGISPRIEGGRMDMGAYESDDGDNDNDNDMLPDDWEVANQLDPNDSTGDEGMTGDPDMDDSNNYTEFIADKDPNVSSSVWEIVDFTMMSPPELHFHSSTARIYTLEYSTNLLDGDTWTNVVSQTDVAGTGTSQSLSDGIITNGRSYRVSVEFPP